MKNAIRLSEEISKNVTTRKFVTTKIEYFCESEDDTKTLTDNITRVPVSYTHLFSFCLNHVN